MADVKLKLFDLDIFKSKRWYNPEDYYLTLARRAVESGLISESEFKNYTAQFLKLRTHYPQLSVARTVQMLEVIVKSRYTRREEILKTQAQSEDDFFDKIINVAKRRPKNK